MKMVDLNLFENEVLPIAMPWDKPEGSGKKEVVKLLKPTRGLVIALTKFSKLKESDNLQDATEPLNNMVRLILNNNDTVREFTKEEVESLNLIQKLAIINAFNEFIKLVQSNPN